MEKNIYKIGKELFITNDEEIKQGNWCLDYENEVVKYDENKHNMLFISVCKKIIITTDQELINDGIQTTPDEFLEWFVKNPSCEEIKVEGHIYKGQDETEYKIIIPKEEPKQVRKDCYCKEPVFDLMNAVCKICGNSIIHLGKKIEFLEQETLEKAAQKYINNDLDLYESLVDGHISYNIGIDLLNKLFIAGAKWQQEKSYSEEDMKQAF